VPVCLCTNWGSRVITNYARHMPANDTRISVAIWLPCSCRTTARDIASTGKPLHDHMELGHERNDVIEEYIGDYSVHRSRCRTGSMRAQSPESSQKVSIALLLRRAMPGSRASISAHIERGERIADAIRERFGCRRSAPMAGQACALGARSVGAVALDQHPLRLLAHCTRTRVVLGHWPDWAPHLQGPWCKPGKGGRPAKLARPRNAT
jgi:hypothetical protein